LFAKKLIRASLNNGEDILIHSDPFLLFLPMVGDGAFGPACGAGDAFGDPFFFGRQSDQIVKDHHDI